MAKQNSNWRTEWSENVHGQALCNVPVYTSSNKYKQCMYMHVSMLQYSEVICTTAVRFDIRTAVRWSSVTSVII